MRLEMIEPGRRQWPLIENGAVQVGLIGVFAGVAA